MKLQNFLQIGLILTIFVLLTKQEKDNADDPISNFLFKRGKNKSGKTKSSSNTPTNIAKPLSKPPGLQDVYGVDIMIMEDTHPFKKFRAGEPTHTHSCDSVKSVPKDLRKESVMYLPIHKYYVKYTEAFGIPIVGSKNVTEEGLKRACYIVRVLLGARWDIRRAFYKLYGRIVLIGDVDEVTNLPEFSKLDSRWDMRARGFGPTIKNPIVAAGDDNQRCKTTDRYYRQDILMHELAHGVEILAARYVVPGFLKRLKAIHTKNQKSRKWVNKYAGENKHELWAVGTQFFHNQMDKDEYKSLGVTDKASLAKYDSELYKLLCEVYSCVDFKIVDRCHNKAQCTLKNNFRLVFDENVKARSQCDVIRSTYKPNTPEGCAEFACLYGGNAFHFKTNSKGTDNRCHLLDCYNTSMAGLKPIQDTGACYNLYARLDDVKSTTKTDSSVTAKVDSLCAFGPISNSPGRCNVPSSQRKSCGGKLGAEESSCHRMGCCWEKGNCYYGTQDCTDKSIYCPDFENQGECLRNPNFMNWHCPTSCGTCDILEKVGIVALKSKCQDKDLACKGWAATGMCKSEATFMEARCPISCKSCEKFKPSL